MRILSNEWNNGGFFWCDVSFRFDVARAVCDVDEAGYRVSSFDRKSAKRIKSQRVWEAFNSLRDDNKQWPTSAVN